MKGKFSIFVAILFLFGLGSSISAQSKHSWTGEYQFENVAKNRLNGGEVASVFYFIKVFKKNNNLSAEFNATGFQTYDSYILTVKVVGDQLNFYYQSGGHGEDKTNSMKFKKGQLLFGLIEKKIRKKTLFLFKPVDYGIYTFGSKQKPVYFSK